MAAPNTCILTYKGSNYLRQRLILATLSGKSVRINQIRSQDDEPGLREYEVNLIRLLDKITNGTRIEVSETGTSLYYQPGLLRGGQLHHECCTQRGIGYYLEVLIALGPFSKKRMNITLTGVTNSKDYPSVDAIMLGALPVLQQYLNDAPGLLIKVKKRGMAPDGGGEVLFTCPSRRILTPIQFTSPGKVNRIRGTAFAVRVSPVMSNRLVDAAKGVLLQFIPDVYIHTDLCRGTASGKSPGYGITLVAQTANGVRYTAEAVSNLASEGPSVPEDVGKEAAFKLLEEIYRGGCIDSSFQSQAALCMALSPKDISKLQTGPLSQYTIHFLRHLREFFGITFKLETYKWTEDEEELNLGANKVVMTCIGTGFTNLSKKTT